MAQSVGRSRTLETRLSFMFKATLSATYWFAELSPGVRQQPPPLWKAVVE